MAEEQAEAEQDKGAQSEEESSTMGRLKSRVKDLVAKDSEEQDVSGDDDESSSEESESSETEAEGSDEESASGEEQEGEGEGESEGDGKVGEYSVDDADPSQHADNEDEARAQMLKLEKDGPPENLADWPTGKAMYLTFGGAEGEASYEGAASAQLGPSSTRHHADGSVEVQGETVDDPDSYKGDKSVFDEADEIGMDKSGKNQDDDESEDDGSSEDGSAEAQSGDESSGEQASGEASSSEQPSGEASSDDESSESSEAQRDSSSEATGGQSDGDDADSDGSSDQQSESETAGTS